MLSPDFQILALDSMDTSGVTSSSPWERGECFTSLLASQRARAEMRRPQKLRNILRALHNSNQRDFSKEILQAR